MKIIKRNGTEVTFDPEKIANAVRKANNEVSEDNRLTEEQIDKITKKVTALANDLNRAVNVEEVQDFVENQIMNEKAFAVARKYITYRYTRALVRRANTTDAQILTLIECNNEEVKQENSNKNPTVNSVQRDYMAGEVSKDLTRRILLPPDIVAAHDEGLIHFHDADYFAQHMHNCDLVNRQPRGYAAERHRHFGDVHREAALLLDGVQHRDADHRAGRLQPIRRAEHLVDAPCALRGRQPSEDQAGGQGRACRRRFAG